MKYLYLVLFWIVESIMDERSNEYHKKSEEQSLNGRTRMPPLPASRVSAEPIFWDIVRR